MRDYQAKITFGKPYKGKKPHIFHAGAEVAKIAGQPAPIMVETSRSNTRITPELGEFTQPDIDAYNRRWNAKDGGKKGRLIQARGQGKLLAFMCLHRPSDTPSTRPLEIGYDAYAASLDPEDIATLAEEMHDCALQISHAESRVSNQLAWATDVNTKRHREWLTDLGFKKKNNAPEPRGGKHYWLGAWPPP